MQCFIQSERAWTIIYIAVTESPTDCDCHAIQLHYMGQYQADQADQANQANQ